MVAKLKAIKAELQRRKHDRTAEVGAWLRKVVLGYYQYHAVPGNTTQLRIFSIGCRLAVAERFGSSQSARTVSVGNVLARSWTDGFLHPAFCILILMLASTPLIQVRAVCVNALVRICAGGDQRWSSLPRQLARINPESQPLCVFKNR